METTLTPSPSNEEALPGLGPDAPVHVNDRGVRYWSEFPWFSERPVRAILHNAFGAALVLDNETLRERGRHAAFLQEGLSGRWPQGLAIEGREGEKR